MVASYCVGQIIGSDSHRLVIRKLKLNFFNCIKLNYCMKDGPSILDLRKEFYWIDITVSTALIMTMVGIYIMLMVGLYKLIQVCEG